MVRKEMDIGTRLREFSERSHIKMPVIALATGIAKETMYKWEKGTKPSDINDYFTLKAYLDKMENKLDDEIIEFENKKPATLRLPLNHRKAAMSHLDGKASAGTVIFTDNEPELIVDRINAPFMGYVDGAVEVTGESMEPTLKNGCRVVINRLQDAHILNWGDYYLIIDINLQRTVKRIYQGSARDTIILVSDNPDQVTFPPVERRKEHIMGIFKVVASISKH
jgi:phage repressor protein C with HTH and peptisase S24 domain